MGALASRIDGVAAGNAFSGVVRVDRGGEIEFAQAYGWAHRGHGIANTLDTQFAIASGAKGLTALTVVSLVEEGLLELATRARSVLGEDLPLIDDGVTVEHLLAHRSGIGDYLDEERRARPRRLPHAGARARARDDRAVRRRARRASDRVPARRAVCVLQRRLRRAGVDRRAGERRALRRARAAARVRTGGAARHGVSALGRAGPRRPRLSGRSTAWEEQRVPPAGAGQRRRRDLLDGSRHQRALAGVPRRSDRLAGVGRRDDAAAERRPGQRDALRARLLAARDERLR